MNTNTSNIITKPMRFFDRQMLLENRRHSTRLTELENMKAMLTTLDDDLNLLRDSGLDIEAQAASPYMDGSILKLELSTNSAEQQRDVGAILEKRGFEYVESWSELIHVMVRECVRLIIKIKPVHKCSNACTTCQCKKV